MKAQYIAALLMGAVFAAIAGVVYLDRLDQQRHARDEAQCEAEGGYLFRSRSAVICLRRDAVLLGQHP